VKDSLYEILDRWSLEDLFEAWDVLNALDEAEREAAKKKD